MLYCITYDSIKNAGDLLNGIPRKLSFLMSEYTQISLKILK